MDNNIPLLLDPPHVLPPDVVLTQGIIKCDSCEKVLGTPYYIFIGIPPSPRIIEALLCESIDNERDKEKSVISDVQEEAKDFEIESKNQWIFSEHNVMSSKIRICTQCYGEYKWPAGWEDPHFISNRIRTVYFAVEEYQRRHTPIESAESDYEKYLISLPDRSNVHWVGFGYGTYGVFSDLECNYSMLVGALADCMKTALIPDCETLNEDIKALYQELRRDIISDKNRMIPTDQELTRWLKKYGSNDTWFNIESCKIFTNPKTFHIEDRIYNTKYSVIVHCVDGDWVEFDI